MANLEELIHLEIINVIEEAENDIYKERRVFQRQDAFSLPGNQFIKLFRLSKELTRNLIVDLGNHIQPPNRISALDVPVKVLTALRFYATGSYQNDIGMNLYTAVSQASVSRCVREVSDALNHPEIFERWVKFPTNINDLQTLRNGFYQQYRFPGVVGCIDCTHVALIAPKIDEHIYVNRKSYHLINVQLVCDHKLRILHVNARYPGSTNDNFIWNNCNLKQFFIHLHNQGYKSFFLLGDSGYALRSYLLTPILNPEPLPNTPEAAYNERQMSTRSIIERCNGVLKMRFRCLFKHRVLHYNPEAASKIINSCVVLHNMCIANNVPIPDIDGEDDFDYGFIQTAQNREHQLLGRVNPELAMGRKIQQNIIQGHFSGH